MTTYADMVALKAEALRVSWMLRGEIATPRPGWQNNADCRGCRNFTTELCTGCPVRLDCLRDAHATDCRGGVEYIHGIRGGLEPGWRHQWYSDHTAPVETEHGTNRGYHQHRTRGDVTCTDCRDAHNRDEADARRRRRRRKVA